ncbi:MAG: OadG family protein [Lachnospiraceae bacterium]|nr:OadG family protein [Bacteroides sp.]MBQ7780868.1 OadG family protein [Lachnospiraceae bacterium]
MNENLMNALMIMGYGMLGIFAAIIIIIFCVWVLQQIDVIGKKRAAKKAAKKAEMEAASADA